MPGFIPWSKVDLPLRAYRSIWVCTTRPDGRPHAVPVWFVWDGVSIYFITRRDMQKARNLAHQPWIVVHAGDGDDVIILEGRVEIVTDQEELQRVNTAYGDTYVAPRTGARDTIFQEGTDLYRVNVKHVMTWEYGVIATRTDWTF
jgi:PPOX class probable F420-dependent enzyme